MRITDVCPLIEDAIAIAALYQCILRLLYRLRRQNQRWRHYPPFLIRENRWRAQRYGVEKGMVDLGKGALVPFSDLLEELFELVAEDAAYFNCAPEIAHARTILQRGLVGGSVVDWKLQRLNNLSRQRCLPCLTWTSEHLNKSSRGPDTCEQRSIQCRATKFFTDYHLLNVLRYFTQCIE